MLELNNVTLGYAGKAVLPIVSYSFEPGMIHTIVGKNGCGKSTLLKCCAGLLLPTAGTVMLNGKELSRYPSEGRAQNISYLSQDRNTPNITVERLLAHSRFPHLSYPKKLRPEDREIIRQSLALMQAEQFASCSLRELSGGERQRIYLAMQLAQDTPILLLDEPTTYLDIEYQLLLMEVLTDLKKKGRTIIMVLHDLEQALRYSDRLIAVHTDEKITSGTPEVILENGTLRRNFHVDVRRSCYEFELENRYL